MMKNVLGLDLGSHAVKAVELRQTLSGVEPVQLRVHPRADPEAPLSELMRRFVKMHQLPLEQVCCAIPSDRLSARRLEFPFRDRKKLAAAVPFEVEGEIPFALEDVLIDWEMTTGERAHAVVQATIVPRREVSTLLESLGEWGCEPRTLEAEGMVLGNLAALFDLPGTRLLVDLGHRKSTFCLLMDGRPISARSVPVAGAALTQAIAKDRDWNMEDAEHAKCEDGIFHIGFDSATPGAVATLDRVAREIVRTLEALQPVLGGAPGDHVAGITLMGGSARLHRVDEYLSERTGIPASRLTLPPDPQNAALVAGGDPVLFAPAIALALRGTTLARTRTDFRQDEFAYRTDLSRYFTKEMRWTAAFGIAALVLLVGQVATGIWLESRRGSTLEGQIYDLYSQAFPEQPLPDRPVKAMRKAVDSARDRADFLGVYGNGSALELLSELSRRVPPELEVKFREVSIDGRSVRIEVVSDSIQAADKLETELGRAAPFTNAKAGEISKERKTGSMTFDVTINLDSPGSSS